ncbi:MAG: hypothetical protein CM1200mP2_32120 [Planctomycetaceae bacterium]|nr:MAG: hypothetical protein CM1200mP2_32120 [Planctomycetaceae bacterium]
MAGRSKSRSLSHPAVTSWAKRRLCSRPRRSPWGKPPNKPPYPGQVGLHGKPTLINNVETFALSVPIIARGADWWAGQGAENFSGLKFVSISGDINQPGVYEIPVGTTVAELIEQAGGVPGGAAVKAFLPGGASSKFLPSDRLNTPLDFDAIAAAGSMLGTGAVIVITEGQTCSIWPPTWCGSSATNPVASVFPAASAAITPSACSNRSPMDQLSRRTQRASRLGHTLEQTSICGLGQVALIPVLSMLEHFPDEVPGT